MYVLRHTNPKSVNHSHCLEDHRIKNVKVILPLSDLENDVALQLGKRKGSKLTMSTI